MSQHSRGHGRDETAPVTLIHVINRTVVKPYNKLKLTNSQQNEIASKAKMKEPPTQVIVVRHFDKPSHIPLDHYTLRTYIILMHTFIELHPFATVRDQYLNNDEFTAFQHI
jgi:hypothetical protein